MSLESKLFLHIKIFFLVIFTITSFAVLADKNKANYLDLTSGLPMEFKFTQNSEVLDGATLQESITFKSVKPAYVDNNGDKWFQRFYFKEQIYITEKLAIKAFEEEINKFTKGKYIATKCPYYSVREGKKIYSISATCNFRWKINRLVSNLKNSFIENENKLSAAIWCKSGGFCKVASSVNKAKH